MLASYYDTCRMKSESNFCCSWYYVGVMCLTCVDGVVPVPRRWPVTRVSVTRLMTRRQL